VQGRWKREEGRRKQMKKKREKGEGRREQKENFPGFRARSLGGDHPSHSKGHYSETTNGKKAHLKKA
jgi:hypothetical protein